MCIRMHVFMYVCMYVCMCSTDIFTNDNAICSIVTTMFCVAVNPILPCNKTLLCAIQIVMYPLWKVTAYSWIFYTGVLIRP